MLTIGIDSSTQGTKAVVYDVDAAIGIEAHFDWASAPAETKIRAIVEGQMSNIRERTRWIGDFDTICVTCKLAMWHSSVFGIMLP